MKYAVYVEGQSELLFVADVLQKYSQYDPQRCGFLCINLSSDDFFRLSFPQQGSEGSADYYQIVNVNNDNRVISKLKNDIPGLIDNGYNVIIGLKDVFGTTYEQLTNSEPIIDRAMIVSMHSAQTSALKAPIGCDCRLHFAIMEYEAWMLALIENFVKNCGKEVADLCQELKIDLATDFENTVYHPYSLVKSIYKACGSDYHKHSGESYSFLSTLSLADYEALRCSGRCASFAKFIDSLLGGNCPRLP